MGESWRDWFRWQCRAIASYTEVELGPDEQMISVVLCRRWRWHRGTCRGRAPREEGKQ